MEISSKLTGVSSALRLGCSSNLRAEQVPRASDQQLGTRRGSCPANKEGQNILEGKSTCRLQRETPNACNMYGITHIRQRESHSCLNPNPHYIVRPYMGLTVSKVND
jgi:hypothetical protein